MPMTKRYRYNPDTKEMEEIENVRSRFVGVEVQGDIEPFVSTVDGTVISSRSHLREHMRKHGLAHASDFDKPGGHWDKARQARADYLAGKTNPDSKRRTQQMSDAWEHARNKSRYSRG